MAFLQGYACAKCEEKDNKYGHSRKQRQPPLYLREKGKFTFSGLVMCPTHGPTKGIRLNDSGED